MRRRRCTTSARTNWTSMSTKYSTFRPSRRGPLTELLRVTEKDEEEEEAIAPQPPQQRPRVERDARGRIRGTACVHIHLGSLATYPPITAMPFPSCSVATTSQDVLCSFSRPFHNNAEAHRPCPFLCLRIWMGVRSYRFWHTGHSHPLSLSFGSSFSAFCFAPWS